MDYKPKCKTIKLQRNIGEKSRLPWVWQWFWFWQHQKHDTHTQKLINWTSLKLISFAIQKAPLRGQKGKIQTEENI